MNTTKLLLATVATAAAAYSSARADELSDTLSKVKVKPVVEFKARAFPLQDVRVTGGPLKQAEELDAKYMLSLDVDQLLHTFRINAGLPSKAKPLGGWEE